MERFLEDTAKGGKHEWYLEYRVVFDDEVLKWESTR